MMTFHLLSGFLAQIIDMGGIIVIVQLCMSAVSLAVVLYKLWQYARAGVGRHRRLGEAVRLWDNGQHDLAMSKAHESTSHLAPVVVAAFESEVKDGALANRLETEAGVRISKLESGFRILDNVAQLAPLVGLLGTVVGMIKAFQAMQAAGANVDPSVLAGGMWVALLTTAVGLVVSMPAAIFLSWFESRVQRERILADSMLQAVAAPGLHIKA